MPMTISVSLSLAAAREQLVEGARVDGNRFGRTVTVQCAGDAALAADALGAGGAGFGALVDRHVGDALGFRHERVGVP